MILDPAHTASASCDVNLPIFQTYSDRNGRREVAMASCDRSMCARIASCHGKLRSLYVWKNGRLPSQIALIAVCAGSNHDCTMVAQEAQAIFS